MDVNDVLHYLSVATGSKQPGCSFKDVFVYFEFDLAPDSFSDRITFIARSVAPLLGAGGTRQKV